MTDTQAAGGPKPTLEQLLDMQRRYPHHSGRKDDTIRRELGLAPARFYVLLSRAIRTEAALAADPVLVHQLRNRLTTTR